MNHRLLWIAALGVAGYVVISRLTRVDFSVPYDPQILRSNSGTWQTVMRVKEGVNSEALSAPVAWALGVAERIFGMFGGEVTVTSANDGKHMDGSKHYSGNAADLRTRDLKPGVAAQIALLLSRTLSAFGFDVVNEGDHIHLEYDPKPGREWLRTVK